jgi:hypothetical protein
MVFNAARDRTAMREREKEAIKKQDEAIAQRDSAIDARNKAVARLRGVEKREKTLEEREKNAVKQEADIKDALQDVAAKEATANALYGQQLELNKLYDEAVVFKGKYEDECENNKKIRGEKENLLGELEDAYWSISAMARAAGSLLWDENLKINKPTQKQEILLKALRRYGERHARDTGFKDIADNINKHYGITKELQEDIDSLTPKPPVRDWGYER